MAVFEEDGTVSETPWEKKIARLTSFLERIKDGKICRRCLASPNTWIIYEEDGSRHSCEREIAREALDGR